MKELKITFTNDVANLDILGWVCTYIITSYSIWVLSEIFKGMTEWGGGLPPPAPLPFTWTEMDLRTVRVAHAVVCGWPKVGQITPQVILAWEYSGGEGRSPSSCHHLKPNCSLEISGNSGGFPGLASLYAPIFAYTYVEEAAGLVEFDANLEYLVELNWIFRIQVSTGELWVAFPLGQYPGPYQPRGPFSGCYRTVQTFY